MELLRSLLKNPPIEFWPEVRWWLAEGFHTDKTLQKDIEMLFEAGFGGVEFLAMDEKGVDPQHYGWGSEEWAHDSCTILREASGRNMGVSFTSGTNWAHANLLTISPDDRAASKELDYTVESLSGGQAHSGPLSKAVVKMPNVDVQELIAVLALKKTGEAGDRTILDQGSVVILTGEAAGGCLDWTAPAEGEWELFSFWLHGTGQAASPSAGISYAINYLDRYGVDALIEYWNGTALTGDMRRIIKTNNRVQMYMDSIELTTTGLGGQIWGYHFIEEFKKRRGYDISPWLPFMVKECPFMGGPGPYRYRYEPDGGDCGAVLFIRKARNDLYQTMTDLYIDNLLRPLGEWLHGLHMGLRGEISYGMPFEISLPGNAVDGIETESLEFASQIEAFRSLAGPAHLLNKPYSSETGATKLNYQMGLDFYTQIIYTQFAAGVGRTVLHGYASIAGSEKATSWPGHEGMWPLFGERFGSRQPAYPHYRGWTRMLARYQMILRWGKPRVDLGILRLDYNFNNLYIVPGSGKNEKDFYENELMRAHRGVYWQDMGLQDAGYTYDYFAPQILEDPAVHCSQGILAPGGPGYRALIIYQEELPLSSARVILSFARGGLPVVIVNTVTEQLRPAYSRTNGRAASISPFNSESDAELAAVIAELRTCPRVRTLDSQGDTLKTLAELGVFPRVSFGKPTEGILTNLREEGDKKYLFVYNYMYTEPNPVAFAAAVEGEGTPYRLDCWGGEVIKSGSFTVEKGRTVINLSLRGGEAALVMVAAGETAALHALADPALEAFERDGRLLVKARSGGVCPVQLSDGRTVLTEVAVPASITVSPWRLEIEDWDEGEKRTITEDRGLGRVTKEVYFETRKTLIPLGETALVAWKDIPSVGPQVSGIGRYTASFTLPPDWGGGNGAELHIGSTHGNTAAVYINGLEAPAYDFNKRVVDISALVRRGENSIEIEVSSTLNNRLLARNYHAAIGKPVPPRGTENKGGGGGPPGPRFTFPGVQDYGLAGPVRVVFYTLQEIV